MDNLLMLHVFLFRCSFLLECVKNFFQCTRYLVHVYFAKPSSLIPITQWNGASMVFYHEINNIFSHVLRDAESKVNGIKRFWCVFYSKIIWVLILQLFSEIQHWKDKFARKNIFKGFQMYIHFTPFLQNKIRCKIFY